MRKSIANGLLKLASAIYVLISANLLFMSVVGNRGYSQVYQNIGLAGELCLTFVAGAILLLLLCTIHSMTKTIKERGLRIVALAIFLMVAIVLWVMITTFYNVPTTDSWTLYDQAKWLTLHPGELVDYSNSPYAGMFAAYPNNHFLTIVFMWLYQLFSLLGIEDPFFPMFVINAIALYLCVVFAYLTVKKEWGLRPAVRVLTLLALNPLTYAYAPWPYSMTLSMPLMTASVYLGVSAYKAQTTKSRLLFAIASGLLGSVSYYIRPTSCIPLVAFFLLGVAYVLRRPEVTRSVATMAAVCLLALVVSYKVIPLTYQGFFSEEVHQGSFPITHWLMMGSHDDGGYTPADSSFTSSIPDYEGKAEATKQATIDNYRSLGVSGTMQLFFRKTNRTFCDGFADSGGRIGECVSFPKLYDFISGSRNSLYVIYCQAFRIATYAMMLIAGFDLLFDSERRVIDLLCPFVFMGGVVFYCLWESKSIYSVPFVPVMLMCADPGLRIIAIRADELQGRTSPRRYWAVCAYALIILVLVVTAFYFPFCKQDYARLDYSRRSFNTGYGLALERMDSEGDWFTQDLPSEKPFNRIEARAESVGEGEAPSEYTIELLDADGKTLYEAPFTSDGSNGVWITFGFPFDDLDGTCTAMRITLTKRGDRKLKFLGRHSLVINHIPGDLVINGEVSPSDLGLNMYYYSEMPLLSSRLYACICLFLVVLTAGLFTLRLLVAHRSRHAVHQSNDSAWGASV